MCFTFTHIHIPSSMCVTQALSVIKVKADRKRFEQHSPPAVFHVTGTMKRYPECASLSVHSHNKLIKR